MAKFLKKKFKDDKVDRLNQRRSQYYYKVWAKQFATHLYRFI